MKTGTLKKKSRLRVKTVDLGSLMKGTLMTNNETKMTYREQLIDLKEALPEEVWPREILIPKFHISYRRDSDHWAVILDQHALDIVTARAERWLLDNGWTIDRRGCEVLYSHTQTRMEIKYPFSSKAGIFDCIIETVEWQVKHGQGITPTTNK